MAEKTRDEGTQLMEGLDKLMQAGKVDEVDEVLAELVAEEPVEDATPEQRDTYSYVLGVRDGIALARQRSGSS